VIHPIPSATYRIQLRGSVGFAEVEAQLDYLKTLGISHLYLSPIFSAGKGSTHGYDVVDPTEIEPELGGREGFEKLARAARERGIGVILDIVPNHTAFSLDNPWLVEVLKHGRDSRYASFFDVDWAAGPLVLPFLGEPFETMLAKGAFKVEGGQWVMDGMALPLADDEATATTADELRALHDNQHWRLRHWETERDAITHRRFFNITGLIGMRVDDRGVFNHTHSLLIELVRQGLVDGLRVDHIDGLADPRTYLDRLAEALPGTPVWVEKILVGEEQLPQDWKTAGTTGYEAARLIARLLTDAEGIERLDTIWRGYTGEAEEFGEALVTAKSDILHNELAAELHQLIGLAKAALADDPDVEPGPESLREAIAALLSGMTRYRTYVDADGANADDKSLLDQIVAEASRALRSARVLEHVARHIAEPRSDTDQRLAVRFQQVSGALLAKAQEDTAGFRWTRFIAANEVGAEPAEPTVDGKEANIFLKHRRNTEMNLTSSHDTKRSEDSRMRLVAISHHPEAFAALVEGADALADDAVPKHWRWYVVQSALAIWGEKADVLKERLGEHLIKAMREAKNETFWTKPNETLEQAVIDFAHQVVDQWAEEAPAQLNQLCATGEALSLAQLALKCLMPGFPDIYRGGEAPLLALTDPDNRLPVNWQAMALLDAVDDFGGEKYRLTRLLLGLRQGERAFFDSAHAGVETSNGLHFVRSTQDRTLVLSFSTEASIPDGALWSGTVAGRTLALYWQG
jgi:(1->4)-alpha-D-glucan 1-alpha-D-glucosylmutase